MRGQSRSLKVSSLPSLHIFSSSWFFLSLCVFFIFCSRRRRCHKKVLETEMKKQKGKNGSQKWKGKLPPFFWFFCVFCFLCVWKEEDAKRKHLKRKCKSKKVEAGVKSERAKRELEGKLLPFSWILFVVFLCVLSSLCLRRRRRRQCAVICSMVLL